MPRKLIMCGDHPVLAFEYDPESGRACSSGEVLDHDRLPLEFTTHGKSALYARRIDEWWRSRAIPSTRDGIRRVLESLGAASTGELLDRTYGLSLSDQYWVRREDDPAEWKDVNFFDNSFDEALGEILLTSYSSSRDISLNVPDVSTGGDLPKRWTIDRATGRRLLVKSGRTGQEPMNEVIASRLCMRLGVPAVRYSLARNGNRLVSTCADMLSNHEELVSAWQVLQSVKAVNGLNSHDQWIRAAVGFCADERVVRDATDDWLVVDYLMRNTDRHYSNFGLIRNIETLAVRPAPIYDTGASLWSGELDVDGRDWFAAVLHRDRQALGFAAAQTGGGLEPVRPGCSVGLARRGGARVVAHAHVRARTPRRHPGPAHEAHRNDPQNQGGQGPSHVQSDPQQGGSAGQIRRDVAEEPWTTGRGCQKRRNRTGCVEPSSEPLAQRITTGIMDFATGTRKEEHDGQSRAVTAHPGPSRRAERP